MTIASLWLPSLQVPTSTGTQWSFQSGVSSVVHGTASTIVTGTVTPNTGDLMVCSWYNQRGTSGDTSAAITDTGSGGWTAIAALQSAGGTAQTGQAWWKQAASSDHNSGSGITVTVTPSGGTGTLLQDLECDIFRLGGGHTTPAADITATTNTTSTVTTVSYSPGSGSGHASFTDALAWASTYARSGTARSGTNTFTATSAATTLTQALTPISGDPPLAFNEYSGLNQASATAGTNVFVTSWTGSSNRVISFGATFVYT